MDPSSPRTPAAAGVEILLDDPAWLRTVRDAAALIARTARTAGVTNLNVVLADDRAVQRLNARHRGRNKPTNVLTFEPAAPGLPGEIVVALQTVRREAKALGRSPRQHLAHLLVHGVLHLAGHDHAEAGEARRMEMAEARLLRRLGVPNPWRRR